MDFLPTDILWRGALAIIPIALLIAAACRFLPTRPTTRHAMWSIALLTLIILPALPQLAIHDVRLIPLTDSSSAETSTNQFARQAERTAPLPPPRDLSSHPAQSSPITQAVPSYAPGMSRPHASRRTFSTSPAAVSLRTPPQASPASSAAAQPALSSGPLTAASGDAQPAAFETEPGCENLAAAPAAMPPADSPIASERLAVSPWPRVEDNLVAATAPPLINTPAAAIDEPARASAALPERAIVAPVSPLDNAFTSLTTRAAAWFNQLVVVRDAVVNLPPFPALLWSLGAILIIAIMSLRVQRSRRLIHRARLAPPSIENMVNEVARDLQLRRVPSSLITDARISPMVWCGLHPRLVLPAELWSQLDDPGRRAIIIHELAHLKRRDHLWCWLELVIGCLYWWHPVVWWIRKRLRDEADDCCDAWVTSLMPASRRAYAQALLETRKFTNRLPAITPAVGLGSPERSTRKLARRLTMVMTHNINPRLSARGFALCGTIALLAYVATPLFACPPEESQAKEELLKEEKAMKQRKTAPRAFAAPRAARAPGAPTPPPPPAPPAPPDFADAPQPDDVTTFERFMRGMDENELDHLPLEEQLEHYRKRIHELERHLQELHQGSPAIAPPGVYVAPRASGIAAFTSPVVAVAPNHVVTVSADGCTIQCQAAAESRCTPNRAGAFLSTALGAMGEQEEIIHEYPISDSGKLEQLWSLLSREDVPVRVSRGENSIAVHGSHHAQAVCSAFFAMIDGEQELSEQYHLSPGKLEALTEFMAREDVPLMIERGEDSITVHGNALEQLIFSAFVRLIDSETEEADMLPARPLRGTAATGGGMSWSGQKSPQASAEIAARLEQAYARAAKASPEVRAALERELAEYHRAVAEGAHKQAMAAEEAARAGVGQRAASAAQHQLVADRNVARQRLIAAIEERNRASHETEMQAERRAAEAERLYESVEQLQEQAEALAEAAEHFSGGDREQLMDKARAIEQRAAEIERQAEDMERRAEELESRLDSLEEQIEELEEHLDDLDDLDEQDDDEDDTER